MRGVALYSVRENEKDFTKSTVTVSYLLAETDDAYAALWRFFVELDLVGEVRAHELLGRRAAAVDDLRPAGRDA